MDINGRQMRIVHLNGQTAGDGPTVAGIWAHAAGGPACVVLPITRARTDRRRTYVFRAVTLDTVMNITYFDDSATNLILTR